MGLSYDERRMTPPEPDGPTCDWCGAEGEIRVESEGLAGTRHKPSITCEDCFTGHDEGPCFDDLALAVDHFRELAEVRGDYLHDHRRDEEAGL